MGTSYRFSQGPSIFDHNPELNREPTTEEAFREGVNCQALVHAVYRDIFGFSIPTNIMSKEMYEGDSETPLFVPVDTAGDSYLMGDIFIFGRRNTTDMRKLHVAVNTGNKNEEGELMILHATKPIGENDSGIYIWPFPHFLETGRYEELYGIRRLTAEFHGQYVQPVINSRIDTNDNYFKAS